MTTNDGGCPEPAVLIAAADLLGGFTAPEARTVAAWLRNLAGAPTPRERLKRRDAILRNLAQRHFRHLTPSAAAERIEAAARNYYAGADFAVARINGAVQPSQRDRPAAAFFELHKLGVDIPGTRQLRRLLAMFSCNGQPDLARSPYDLEVNHEFNARASSG